MWRRQGHGSLWPGALLLSPYTILHSDLALPRVRLILGGGSPLCRLSEGLSQLTTQLPFQRLPRDVAVRIWNLERNLLVSHSSYLTMTGCMGPRSIQEEILIKEKWSFG